MFKKTTNLIINSKITNKKFSCGIKNQLNINFNVMKLKHIHTYTRNVRGYNLKLCF